MNLQNIEPDVRNQEQADIAASGGINKCEEVFPLNEGLMENSMPSEKKLVLIVLLSQVIHKPRLWNPNKLKLWALASADPSGQDQPAVPVLANAIEAEIPQEPQW